MIGYLQYLIALFCEGINIYMLTFQKKVEYCIIYFVALHVIMEIPKMYFESLGDHQIKEVLHFSPKR